MTAAPKLPITSVRELIVNIALWQLGFKESPPTSNKTKYGHWYGMDGVKWCAIFVSWVYAQAGVLLGMLNVVGFAANGYHHCESAYNHWKRNGKLTTDPQPGDVIIYDWELAKGATETDLQKLADHTGIFIQWLDRQSGTFEAVEGNTASGNDSDGGEVELRQRNVKLVKAFVNVLD